MIMIIMNNYNIIKWKNKKINKCIYTKQETNKKLEKLCL